jgi:hypothetical protein
MLRKNLFSLLDSPLKRWLGIALLLVVALTPLTVHTLTSKKAHAASDVTIHVYTDVMPIGAYGASIHYVAPGASRTDLPCVSITASEDALPHVPQGTQMEVTGALDFNCQRLLGGSYPLPVYPDFPLGYASQRIIFNVGNATRCDVHFFAGGTEMSSPSYKCS